MQRLGLILAFVFIGGIAMGYDIHITRASEWSESEKTPIAVDAWKKVIAEDKSFVATNAAVATNPKTGEEIRVPGAAMAIWTDSKTGKQAHFDYRQGRITVKNPDEAMIAKMKDVAKKLGARVVGDEGEEY